jgi:uncharacterized membrane protein
MTSPPPELQRIASPAPAHRLAALLLGSGVLHFLMPKPYDTIVPAELPGSQRFYTYASGVAELAAGALLLPLRTRRLGALSAVAVFVGVLVHAAVRDRPPATADPDDHRGAEDLPQRLSR